MSSESSSDEEEELSWYETLQRIKENDSCVDRIDPAGDYIQDMTNEGLEELGKDIADNTHLVEVNLSHAALNDHRISIFSRGLARSNTMKFMTLMDNGLSAAGVRSMVPFLQNANNLTFLDLDCNDLQSEGFNLLLRSLSDCPIEELHCNRCGIDSIEIDTKLIPRHLKGLHLRGNSINADGCRGLAKLLQGGDATLETLYLGYNEIDDEGVEILVNALQSNTSLTNLELRNKRTSRHGNIMLLKLVNDISSIDATLRSNHTLKYLLCADDQIQILIDYAITINSNVSSQEAAGREKVIWTQLESEARAELAELQGVNHSVYSEIDPLHLPEVLALVGRRLGQKELYIALRSSIAGLISTVNRKECIIQQRDYHLAKAKQLDDELAAINEAAQGGRAEDGESRSSKRRRKWWWGLWGR